MVEGKCQGCGEYGEVDDIGLCESCGYDLEVQDDDNDSYDEDF